MDIEGPGAISNFKVGILVSGASHIKLGSSIIQDNKEGVYIQNSNDFHINGSIIKKNDVGIRSVSSDHVSIQQSLWNGNSLAGIAFANTHDSMVYMNNIDGSQNGVFVDVQSAGNKVTDNNILHNVIDINYANGSATNVNKNQLSGNNCLVSNPKGICIGIQ